MLKVIDNTSELEDLRKSESLPVGFVPTMGNLHAGHISLLEEALKEFKTVYFSIFVNPKQFGPNEDFARYPRTLKEDISLIEKSLGRFPNSKVIVYAPKDPAEVFPETGGHTVSVLELTGILEGEKRSGHFDGVTTVVHRLFELIRPEKAFFGLKDYQQWAVIKKMVNDLLLPIEIVGMPIIREDSGLALSSRNQYLNPEQKEASLILSRSLKDIAFLIDGKKENLSKSQDKIQEMKKDPHWDYLEIRDADSLSSDLTKSNKITILGVYKLGSTRLLDNLQMEIK